MSGKQPDIGDNLDYRRLVKQLQDLPAERLDAFDDFMRMAEREEHNMDLDLYQKFAEAMATRLRKLHRGIDALNRKRLPRGFWRSICSRFKAEGVHRPEGGDWTEPALSQYFKFHEAQIRPLVEAALSGGLETTMQPSSNEIPLESGKQDARDQEPLESGKHDTSDQTRGASVEQIARDSKAIEPVKHAASLEDRVVNVERVIAELRKELQALRGHAQPPGQILEVAPLPPRKSEGKGFEGKRKQFASYVDEVLLDGMKEAAKQRRITLAHAIETAFWLFLDKPRLSFDKGEEPRAGGEQEAS